MGPKNPMFRGHHSMVWPCFIVSISFDAASDKRLEIGKSKGPTYELLRGSSPGSAPVLLVISPSRLVTKFLPLIIVFFSLHFLTYLYILFLFLAMDKVTLPKLRSISNNTDS